MKNLKYLRLLFSNDIPKKFKVSSFLIHILRKIKKTFLRALIFTFYNLKKLKNTFYVLIFYLVGNYKSI